MARKSFLGLMLVALLVAFTLPAVAQESAVKGNLSGTVYDSTGAVVPQAKITLTGPTGTKTVDADNEGHFMFPLLTPGFYQVKVERQGFKVSEVKGIEIATNKTSAIRVSIEPGAVSEVVEVSAPAVTVDTSSTAVSSNLTDSFYTQVPVARNVTGLFYVAPGAVSAGNMTTRGNPSISGGSGLENQYVADGVNITDGAFGGLGVFSRNYGSLSTGINLSFVQEVQVKTGGFEPQYGKATGGVVQIVTKSGGDSYHGAVSAYFAPAGLEAERLQPDFGGGDPSQSRFNQNGQITHQSGYDVSGEVGGYVPGFQNKLFFFGSFNPSWNRDDEVLAQLHDVPYFLGGPSGGLGAMTAKVTAYNYAAKLTWKINPNHTLEGSVFGDPSRTPMQNGAAGGLRTAYMTVISPTTFDKLSLGTRNVVARYNGTLSPTWLVNASASWGHNYLSDTPSNPDIYSIGNNMGCLKSTAGGNDGIVNNNDAPNGCLTTSAAPLGSPLLTFGAVNPNPYNGLTTGGFVLQGYGYSENTTGDNYGLELDTQKSFKFLGDHTVSVGYKLDRNFYDGVKARTGGFTPLPMTDASGTLTPSDIYGASALAAVAASPFGANFANQLRTRGPTGAGAFMPLYPMPDGSTPHVTLYNPRGEFGDPNFNTAGTYHAIYGMDSWSPFKYLTINAGLRWEQQYMQGTDAHYTWVGNWSPRIGVTVDPWGDRKTKVYVNFGRYNYGIPLDMAIRSLSAEEDMPNIRWEPHWVGEPTGVTDARCPSPCSAFIALNPDGTLPNPTFDAAHLVQVVQPASISTGEAIAPGTKMESLDEWVVGFERDFGHGVIFSARYVDRRMKRIVEDMAGISAEAFNAGVNQQYFITNPTPNTDRFINPIQVPYDPSGAVPSQCVGYNGAGNFATFVAGTVPFQTDVVNSFNQSVASPAGSTNTSVCIVPQFKDPLAFGNDVPNYPGGAGPGDPTSDGLPDGFAQPVRNYQAVEFEVNKSFSKNWQIRSNWRIAKLKGNYEGAFRNDNAQTDPSISSLFDFTPGDFNLLGDQFANGYLNTDRRHVVNTYFSYVFDRTFMKGLTIGTGLRVQSGAPINDLKAHPAYQNAGEIPVGGRGSLGRFPTTGQVDLNLDYAFHLTEKSKLHLSLAMFNIANMKRLTNEDQNEDRVFGVANVDFKRPVGIYDGFQRPFYARVGVKWEF